MFISTLPGCVSGGRISESCVVDSALTIALHSVSGNENNKNINIYS